MQKIILCSPFFGPSTCRIKAAVAISSVPFGQHFRFFCSKVPVNVDDSETKQPTSSVTKFDLLCEPLTPDQILFGKSKARERGFQTKMKPISLVEWERTWERWRNEHHHWKQKLEERPTIFCPTPLQCKMLVITGVYESVEQVPAYVSMHTVKKSVKRKVRFALGTIFTGSFTIWMLFNQWAPP